MPSPVPSRHRRRLAAIPAVVAAAIVAACASPPPPGTPEAEAYAREQRTEAVETTVDDIPGWYIDEPQDPAAMFATGSSTSSDLQLALDKAVLNAKRGLADRLNSRLSSKMKEFLSETGSDENTQVLQEVERITSNLITEVNVAGYTRDKTEVLPNGTQYRAYVLLRYPLGSANRLLVDQVQKSQLVESRVRASKAFQELEQDIKEARQQQN